MSDINANKKYELPLKLAFILQTELHVYILGSCMTDLRTFNNRHVQWHTNFCLFVTSTFPPVLLIFWRF